jgi:NAD(P)-dependent dehydrogenase (short-subunit alcohol dehydrogenase family)
MLLKEKSVLVTGAAAGIGQSIAKRMSEEGASLVLADIKEKEGRALESQLRGSGCSATFIPVDLAKVASIRSMVQAAIATMGRIDVLVNNGGVTQRLGLFEIDEEKWDWIQSINTRGLFFCLQAVALHMKERRSGKIINIASIGGKGVKGTSNASYSASKAAAIAISRVAAQELGPFNINVNSVCPGLTRTEMLADLERANPALLNSVRAMAALNRINEPVDVANAVVFLSSSLADNITGQSLNVDSGILWD